MAFVPFFNFLLILWKFERFVDSVEDFRFLCSEVGVDLALGYLAFCNHSEFSSAVIVGGNSNCN